MIIKTLKILRSAVSPPPADSNVVKQRGKFKYVKILVNDPFNNSSGRRKAAGTTNKLELGILFLKLPKSKKVFMCEKV